MEILQLEVQKQCNWSWARVKPPPSSCPKALKPPEPRLNLSASHTGFLNWIRLQFIYVNMHAPLHQLQAILTVDHCFRYLQPYPRISFISKYISVQDQVNSCLDAFDHTVDLQLLYKHNFTGLTIITSTVSVGSTGSYFQHAGQLFLLCLHIQLMQYNCIINAVLSLEQTRL